MSQIDDLVANNSRYATGFAAGDLPGPPARRVTVITCMDARIDPVALLGLQLGEAHVLRNAGGVVTDDVIRSLAISQRALGTNEVMVVQHTSCGMKGLDEAALGRELEEAAGEAPPFALGGFEDLDQSVRDGVDRIYRSPFVANRNDVRGFVYDVTTGRLREVV